MKKALRKDFYMEIRKSYTRFISIFLIVALGVAFYTGIQATSPDMRYTGDAYFDGKKLMDLRVIGTLGLTDRDVSDLLGLEGVEEAEGAYSTDVLSGEEAESKVLHLESLTKNFNMVDLLQGSIPAKSGECLLDAQLAERQGYQVGDIIAIEEDGDPLLAVKELKVTGIGSSSMYISFTRGSTTLGTGEIDGFAYVTADTFDTEAYTQIFLRATGAKEKIVYTDEYDEVVDQVEKTIKGVEEVQCLVRYEEVTQEANEKLADARRELADGKKEADEKLADARKELADAQKELDDGQKEYDDGAAQLKDAQKELDDGKNALEDGRNQYREGLDQLAEGKQKLKDSQQELESSQKQLAQGETQLRQGQQELDENRREAREGLAQLTAQQEKLEESLKEIQAQEQTLKSGQQQITASRKQLDRQQELLDSNARDLDTNQKKLDAGREQLNQQKSNLEQQQAELNQQILDIQQQISQLQSQRDQLNQQALTLDRQLQADEITQEDYNQQMAIITDNLQSVEEGLTVAEGGLASLNEGLSSVTDGLNQIAANLNQLDESQVLIDQGREAITDGQEELDKAQKQINQEQKKIDDGNKQIQSGLAQIKKGQKEIDKARQELNDGFDQLDQAQEQLNEKQQEAESAKAQISDGQNQISAGWSQIASSQQELNDAWKEIQENEQTLIDGQKEIDENKDKLIDGKKELEEGRTKLADGQKEYEDAKAEAEDTIADGEKEIADAQKEIEDLEEPEWIISTRDDLPEYGGYGDNAQRIHNIGQVFPVLFFLVAALISLTTMTRMVEEQRTQIGTLKALGYSQASIAAKYLLYAFTATVGGSVLGALIGEKALPYIIIRAYGIMYQYMDTMVIPYEAKYTLLASGAALICTIGATISACHRELKDTPASLMRPPAPKAGKRVFLERITVIWSHLSFTWKSTVRNLMRYKKRFFMTVFGIGGCMALILIGFGIQDSIMDIASLQYKDIQRYDGIVIQEDKVREEDKESLEAHMTENPGVDAWADVYFRKMTAHSGKNNWDLYLYVPEDVESFSKFITLRDRITHQEYKLDDEGMILSEKTAKLLDVDVGDTVHLGEEGKSGGDVKIAEICENYMQHYAYMTPAVYEEIFGEQPEYSEILFAVKEEYKDQAETVGRAILREKAALSISYTASVEEQLGDMLGALDSVLVVLIVSAGMLAFVVLYNLNNINITERKRELATIKVLGFYDKEVSAYVFRENIVLTLFGVIAGVFLGIVLHRFIIVTVEVDVCMFGRNINLSSFLFSSLFTVGFSAIVNGVMHFKLKKIDMVESLKSVE